MKRFLRPGVVLVALAFAVATPTAATATPAKLNGSGSTYVLPAMQQWTADAQVNGLSVNYTGIGSPQGLTQFGQNLVDFAGTEAEYSALGGGGGGETQRGYQYVPDVAGAVAIMYNVDDKAGRKVDYLHLARDTIARIFIGDISRWSDPAIKSDNGGLELPDQPIEVVYRGGQSGTTALFYDFVQHIIPDKFNAWAARNQLPTSVRIIQLDSAPNFAPKATPKNDSAQIAQYVGSSSGKWAIAYDEFSFAKIYHVPAAWVQNQAAQWVLPYAQNISAALEAAQLRPDLSQELSGVYASANPQAYPISAYSYLVTQCAASGQRATCKGAYTNPGVTETLHKWMRYIACEGQVNMADVGYSPLPPNLSQELVNSIARMEGTTPEQLSSGNCVNPRFRGSLGEGAVSPKDPLAGRVIEGKTVGSTAAAGTASHSSTTTAGAAGASQSAAAALGSGASSAAGGAAAAGAGGGALDSTVAGVVGRDGAISAVGGGSPFFRAAAPVAYNRGRSDDGGSSAIPAVLLVLLVGLPPIVLANEKLLRELDRKWFS